MATGRSTGSNSESHEDRFLTAFDEYGDALFRHAFMRINDRERAVDIVHDTFAKVWGYVRQGHAVDNFRPFLYKVLNNLIIDEYRKKKERSLDELMEGEGVDEGNFEELTESTVESLAATLDGKKAFQFVAELPPQYKEVVVLRFVDGLGPKEISQLIEVSENVVSVRLHRGLQALRDKLNAAETTAAENRARRKQAKN